MSREVCGICWCPYDEFTGGCACPPASIQKSTLRTAAQQALEALQNCANGEDDVLLTRDALAALRAALAEPEFPIGQATTDVGVPVYVLKKAEPVQKPAAWRTFDGEGGYDYCTYEDNEDYAAEWAKRNPRHVGWVEPLYTSPPQRKP